MDFSQFVSRLTNPKRSANGVEARCPSHHDQANSLSVGWNEAGEKILIDCKAGCAPDAVCAALGLTLKDLFGRPQNGSGHSGTSHNTRETGKSGLTLREFGNAKGFDPEWLAGHGIHEEKNALVFRYLTMDGQKAARQRLRLALEASGNSKKFIWSNGSGPPTVFGLWLLNGWLKAGLRDLYLVEGESDSLTLWRHGMAALGIPGADMCGKLAAPHIRGFSRIFVVKEADEGGETFVKGMTGQLGKLGFRGQAAVIQMTIMGVKDTNALTSKR